MIRTLIIVAALVVVVGGVWYYLGMPGYAPGEMPAATGPAATSDTTAPAADAAQPAMPGTP